VILEDPLITNQDLRNKFVVFGSGVSGLEKKVLNLESSGNKRKKGDSAIFFW
jgi:hypothetical protein